MKTKMLVTAVVLAVGIVISPVLGMTMSPTRNLILRLAPQEAILTLADKISEQKELEQQKSEIISPEENAQEEVQMKEGAPELQPETNPVVQTVINKGQTEECQNTKKECEEKIKNLKNGINNLENQVEEQEKSYNEAKEKYGDSTYDVQIKMLKYRKLMLEKSEKDLKSRKSELQNITGGECKNYNKPC